MAHPFMQAIAEVRDSAGFDSEETPQKLRLLKYNMQTGLRERQ
jgi:hypothetical protein